MAYEVPVTPYNPPQFDPAASMQRILALRSLMNGQQLQQQQIQGAQLENQIRQRQLASQQALQGLFPKFVKRDESGQPTGYDYDGLMSAAGAAGVDPATLEHLQTMRKTVADTVESETRTKGMSIDQQQKLLGQGFQHLEGIRGVSDPAQRQAQWNAALEWGKANGQDVSKMPQQAPDDNGLTQLEAMLGMHAQSLADIKARGEASAAQSEATIKGVQADAARQFGGLTPEMQKLKYQDILQRLKSKQPVTPTEVQWARGYELSERKTSTSSDSLGVTQSSTSGPSGLAAVGQGGGNGGGSAPAANAKQSMVDAIGNYQMDPALLGRTLYRHPDVLGLLREKYPDWDQTTYNAKNKLIQGYTSGTQSKEINAINTAMGHVRVLDDAVDALNNGNITKLNQIGNSLGINVTGQTAAAAFKLIVNRVGPEISSAYIPGGGGEHERFANQADFSADLPPQTLHNNAAITVKLLRSKVGALENQYKNTVGRDDFQQKFITPEAQAAFQKFGGGQPQQQGGSGKANDPFAQFGGVKH